MLTWLKTLTDEEIGKIVAKLMAHGRVTDACGVGVGSTVIEAWDDNCTDYLRSYGYKGGSLCPDTEIASDGSIIYVLRS